MGIRPRTAASRHAGTPDAKALHETQAPHGVFPADLSANGLDLPSPTLPMVGALKLVSRWSRSRDRANGSGTKPGTLPAATPDRDSKSTGC